MKLHIKPERRSVWYYNSSERFGKLSVPGHGVHDRQSVKGLMFFLALPWLRYFISGSQKSLVLFDSLYECQVGQSSLSTARLLFTTFRPLSLHQKRYVL